VSGAAVFAKALDGRKVGSGWIARCPAHDDRNPSLSTPREAGFVDDLLKNYRTLADNQRAWLSALDVRLRGERR
jgi:hypothetical protein